MVIKEFYGTRKDNIKLYKSYSNNLLKIKKVGTEEIYEEAIDVEDAQFEYVETDLPIEKENILSEEKVSNQLNKEEESE